MKSNKKQVLILYFIIGIMAVFALLDLYRDQERFQNDYEANLNMFQHHLNRVDYYLGYAIESQTNNELQENLMYASIWISKLKVSTAIITRFWETMGIRTYDFVKTVMDPILEYLVFEDLAAEPNQLILKQYQQKYTYMNQELKDASLHQEDEQVIQTKLTQIVKYFESVPN